MEGNRTIDYQAAAERLLVALSFIAERLTARRQPSRPVAAITLCAHVFAPAVRAPWTRETKRRRIRDTATVARKLLAQQAGDGPSPSSKPAQLIGTGAGYLLDADPRVIAWYAGQRRRAGLTHLTAAAQVKRTAALAGQPSLFPSGADALVGRGGER